MLCLVPPLRWERRRMMVGNDVASCVHHVHEDRCLCVSSCCSARTGGLHPQVRLRSQQAWRGGVQQSGEWLGWSEFVARVLPTLHRPPSLKSHAQCVCVCVYVCVHARCHSSPWRPLARGSPPTAFAQVLCPGAVRWRTLGGPVPSSLPTSLSFFCCVSATLLGEQGGCSRPWSKPRSTPRRRSLGCGSTRTRTMSSITHTRTMLSPHSLYSMHHCRCCWEGGGSVLGGCGSLRKHRLGADFREPELLHVFPVYGNALYSCPTTPPLRSCWHPSSPPRRSPRPRTSGSWLPSCAQRPPTRLQVCRGPTRGTVTAGFPRVYSHHIRIPCCLPPPPPPPSLRRR
jgi:hypothetical protein